MNDFSYMLKDDQKNRDTDEENEKALVEFEKSAESWFSLDSFVSFIWKTILVIFVLVIIVVIIALVVFAISRFFPFTFGNILR